MAAVYMLHVETTIGKEDRPKMSNGSEGVDMVRREVLKRFTKWVQCQCKHECGKEWNFVNEVGLCRPETSDNICGLVKFLKRGSFMNALRPKELKAFEATKKAWEAATHPR